MFYGTALCTIEIGYLKKKIPNTLKNKNYPKNKENLKIITSTADNALSNWAAIASHMVQGSPLNSDFMTS